MEAPQITILMAIYKPHMPWLYEQLASLNEQTYANLKLLVWNDCPTDTTDYEPVYNKYITKFPYEIYKGAKNLGSNGAFGELTRLADSEYIAYCDQDDVWLPEKLTTLMEVSQQTQAEVVCSDMYVIDGTSVLRGGSITDVRPRHIFTDGKEQFTCLLSRNFVTGCTTLVRTDFAKRILPFPQEFVHDTWLALHASADDSLHIVRQPLIKYRLHENNQTTVLAGVTDKASYREKRLQLDARRLELLEKYFCGKKPTEIARFKSFVSARLAWQYHPSWHNFMALYALRTVHKGTVYFELAMPFMLQPVFRLAVGVIRRGMI